MADTNAQKISQFNQQQQQKQAIKDPNATTPIQQPEPQATPNTPTLHAGMSVNDIALLQKDPATLSKDEAIRRKAIETKENLRQAEELKKQQEEQQLEQARREGKQAQVVRGELIKGLRSADARTQGAQRWILRAPTVGGIGTLLLLIAIFLLAIVPVNTAGDTRLGLIWLTLTGKTSLAYSANPSGVGGAVQSYTVPIQQAPVQSETTTVNTNPYVPPTPPGGASLDLFGPLFGGTGL